MLVPLTPLQFMRRAVQLFGRKVGVVDGERRLTYAEFGERCDRLANALLAQGLARGQRVAVLAFNGVPLLEATFGVIAAGGVLLPLNVRLSARELGRIVEHAAPALLLVDAELAGMADALARSLPRPPALVWIGEPGSGRPEPRYDAMLAAAAPGPPPELGVDENEVAELFYTSGTTAEPRGVMLTHRNLYLHALSVLIAFRSSEQDVHLHTIPLFHVNGWGAPQAITAVGGTHVMLRKFDPAEVLRLVEAERVTRLLLVPTMLGMLLSERALGRDLSSLELVNVGGAPLAPELARRAEVALGCPVIGGYGLTETSPTISLALAKSTCAGQDDAARLRRQSSAGLPLVGVELGIVDERGQPLPWDGATVGEIVVRSNLVARGYWHDDAATAAALQGGWFHTGDLGTIDAEGYVLVVDRKKDIIITGGENVSSLEVEQVLYEHPAVAECAVIGVPDEHWGETVAAVVVLRPDAEATEHQLVSFCRSRLSGLQVPKTVDIVTELPRSGTGKILKRELRERQRREASGGR